MHTYTYIHTHAQAQLLLHAQHENHYRVTQQNTPLRLQHGPNATTQPVSIKHGLRTADWYKIRTRNKTRLQTADWV